MAWMSQRNEFSEDNLSNLFHLNPGSECDIRTISWCKSESSATEPELKRFTSEEEYRSWVTQCREPSGTLTNHTLVLVMHARLEGENMKWSSLPYGKETLRQTCQKLKQHRSLAHFIGRTSTGLFQNRMVKWGPEGSSDQSFVYHCRSDTESVRTPDDITISSTFMLDSSTTLAVMYGCTPRVMKRPEGWLKQLKGHDFHPMTFPIIFAELERDRLLDVFSLQNTQVHQRILHMETMIKQDSMQEHYSLGIQEMTRKDCDSTKLWIEISTLKGGLGSFKTQLESMSRHSRMLSDTVFKGPDSTCISQRVAGDKIAARLEEMIAEIEGKIVACDGLLGGMTLSMKIESNYYTRRDADANKNIAESNIEIAYDAKRDSHHMQTMSFLGMMFLPGTFFATMFSMSFFRFDPSEGTPLISPWIGIYIGLTTLCTFLVHLSWKRYTKKEDDRRRAADWSDPEKAVSSQSSGSNPSTPPTPSTACTQILPPYTRD
ncbi:hypothetical protein N0V93_008756 [Gnomoniopsis smithogilvyi]|uniref:Uncharacterized protein n=1 Tax=Gnomoniopsis smithogilvyi TaxID=1191159 RepID=A0A9W8YQM0_9PEZI|nr:hypothetical protein N0V93_008756 [Gnomoniopsis smithogilvyi]